MCCMMIVHPPDAQPFTRVEFEDFDRRNPNGFGAIWRTPTGAINAHKGMIGVGRQWQLYRSLIANGCEEMVLHWRYATAGARNAANCHPFEVNDDVLLMHNGVLSHRSTSEFSDTWCFVVDVIRPALTRDPRALWSERWHRSMAQRIGGGNKLVLWHRDEPRPVIIGEDRGLWYRGRWMSNTYAWTVPADAWPKRKRRYLKWPVEA